MREGVDDRGAIGKRVDDRGGRRRKVRAGAAILVALAVSAAAPSAFADAASALPPTFYGGYDNVTVTTSYVPRSPAVRTAGLLLILAGGLALVAAPIVGASGTSSGSDPTAPAATDGAVTALAAGGIGLLLVGVPSALWGSKLVPPSRVSAARGGLRISF